jgi:hypothetical protein
MDSLPYFYAQLNGLLFERQLNVRFFGELLSSSRVAFADQVVHDDKVNVPADVQLANWQRNELRVKVKKQQRK